MNLDVFYENENADDLPQQQLIKANKPPQSFYILEDNFKENERNRKLFFLEKQLEKPRVGS